MAPLRLLLCSSVATLLAATLGAVSPAAALVTQTQSDATDEGAPAQAWSAPEDVAVMLEGLLDRDDIDTRLVRLLLSEVHLAAGAPESAAETLEAVGDPYDSEVQRRLGLAYRAAANAQLARGASWEDVGYFLELARAALQQSADASPPGDTRAAEEIIDLLLYDYGDDTAAWELADGILTNNPENPEVLLLRGQASLAAYWSAYERGDWGSCDGYWDAAESDLAAAAESLGPDRSEPYEELVWLYAQRADRSMDAVRAAAEVLDRTPGATIDDLYFLATAYARSGDHTASGAALEALVERLPQELTDRIAAEEDLTGTAEALSYSSLLHHVIDRGELTKARRVYGALAAAGPESADLWNNYGLLCRDTGAYEESYRAYRRSMELDGSDPRVLNDTALVLHYHLAGDDPELLEQARGLYERCIEMAAAGLEDDTVDPERKAYLAEAYIDASNNLLLLKAAQAYATLETLDG